jgi:hypothetical protein
MRRAYARPRARFDASWKNSRKGSLLLTERQRWAPPPEPHFLYELAPLQPSPAQPGQRGSCTLDAAPLREVATWADSTGRCGKTVDRFDRMSNYIDHIQAPETTGEHDD